MPYLKTKAAILAKKESTYGTDATPDGTNAILCGDPSVEPIGRALERNNVKGAWGAKPKLNIGDAIKLTFKTEARGSGVSAITPPDLGVLFEGCGMVEDVGVAQVDYIPTTDMNGASLSIYYYLDGMLFKCLGARGTVSLELKAGEYGMFSWEFTGLYAGPVTGTAPSPLSGLSTVVPARFVSANFTFDGEPLEIATLKVDVKMTQGKRVDANAPTGIKAYILTEREVSGSIDPMFPDLGDYDLMAEWAGSEGKAITAQLGSVAGNIMVVSGPRAQLSDPPKLGDRDNLVTAEVGLTFLPTATGDDEVLFTFK